MAEQQTTKPAPEALARFRLAQDIKPSQWFRSTYEVDGADVDLWAEVQMVLHKEQIGTGRKFVQIIGMATDGKPVQHFAARGDEVLSLTVPHAKRCGMTLPAVDEETADA
ncbi:hypothetical protein GCM10009613_60830 [Pseudonocardia kongjuensis]|uniref:Uncharacterized protein n=1 Tax=Pseudonocardia kongjuensis TaxID=102227 RepID=A0ABN1Y9Q6_9PSEU